MSPHTTRVRNARIEVACHRLADGPGPALLLLHGLYGSAADWPEDIAWQGPVHALDFSGHGASDHVRGAGYTPELFVADADAALTSITGAAAAESETGGDAPTTPGVVLAGAGLGAYVALLLAGARPSVIDAALLAPGCGLGETDGEPDFERTPERMRNEADVPDGCDPLLWRYIGEIKPRDYVESFAARAKRLLLLEDGGERPTWWQIARSTPHSEATGPEWTTALSALASACA